MTVLIILIILFTIGNIVCKRSKAPTQKNIEKLGWEYKGQHWFYKNDHYYCTTVNNEMFGEVNIFMHVHNSDDDNLQISIIEGSSNNDSYSLEGGTYLFNGMIRNTDDLKLIMDLTM